MSTATYEFNEAQNVTFAALARWMRITAGFLYAFAAMQTFGLSQSLPDQLAMIKLFPQFRLIVSLNIALGVVIILTHIAVAIWTSKGASAFRLVVDTKGNDLNHLMVALEHLRKTYKLIFNFLGATCLLMLIWWLYSAYLVKLLMVDTI